MGSRLFQRSATAFVSFSRKTRSSPSVVASGASNSSGGLPHTIPAPPSRFSRPQQPFFSRLPVELAGGESLIPLHSATASSLLISMLSSKVGQWSSLSEGFATPL